MNLHTAPIVTLLAVWSVSMAAVLSAEPQIQNPSFEQDRFTVYPGYAGNNGKQIAGWRVSGNIGINPVTDPKKPSAARPFADNGKVPHGKQVLFIQNEGSLSQLLKGLRKGETYRIQFRENARAYNRVATPPRLTVTLGTKTIVSPHSLQAVDEAGRHVLPYWRVESDVFHVPHDGDFELVFKTLAGGGVTVLIDDVRILAVPDKE